MDGRANVIQIAGCCVWSIFLDAESSTLSVPLLKGRVTEG
jgi:hypothetical protein